MNLCVLPTDCIYVFLMNVTINSDYYPKHNWLVFTRDVEMLFVR